MSHALAHESNSRSRLRPLGSSRLFHWKLVQDVDLGSAAPPEPDPAGSDPIDVDMDPVIESANPDAMTLAFGSLARFRIEFAQQVVRLVDAHPSSDQDTIDHLVDDHIAPRIIAAAGHLVLHGSATVIGDWLAVFLGNTGAGKSTLAASLHASGHRLLGDDAVVITESSGQLMGEPVYQSLRLFHQSIDQVFGGKVGTSAMAFYSDKVHVALDDVDPAMANCVRLGAIYVLGDRETGVSLDRIAPADACMALVENSFALDPHDPAAAAQRMAQAASLAAAIPCYELAYPYDFSLLSEVRAQVIASLAQTPAAI